MSNMEDEETMMIHNLIPVIIFRYGDDVKTYFFPDYLETTKDNYWDDTLKTVMSKTDKNMAEAE